MSQNHSNWIIKNKRHYMCQQIIEYQFIFMYEIHLIVSRSDVAAFQILFFKCQTLPLKSVSGANSNLANSDILKSG